MASGNLKTVRIECPSIIGNGVRITEAETGEEIPSVFSATVEFAFDDVVRVNLGMYVEKLDVQGIPRLFLLGSKDGWETRKEVMKVVFADGSELTVENFPRSEEKKVEP